MSNPVTVSEAAFLHFKQSLASRPESLGIRLAVTKRGCSGLSYAIDFAKEILEPDLQFSIGDVLFTIDKESLPYLEGMHIDCVQEGLNAHLKISNPNATGACGCGESFTTE